MEIAAFEVSYVPVTLRTTSRTGPRRDVASIATCLRLVLCDHTYGAEDKLEEHDGSLNNIVLHIKVRNNHVNFETFDNRSIARFQRACRCIFRSSTNPTILMASAEHPQSPPSGIMPMSPACKWTLSEITADDAKRVSVCTNGFWEVAVFKTRSFPISSYPTRTQTSIISQSVPASLCCITRNSLPVSSSVPKMPVTTRKRSAPATNPQPSDEDLFNSNLDAARHGAVTYRDDDPFERAFDKPVTSVEQDDSESEVSDFADRHKKRKSTGRIAAKKERMKRRKIEKKLEKKQQRGLSREPDLPELSDDIATSEDEDGDVFNSGAKISANTCLGNSSLSGAQKQSLLSLMVSGMPDTIKVADLVRLIAASATNHNSLDSEESTLVSNASSTEGQKIGFMNFPFEVRIRIYRMCFKDDTPIDFTQRENFSRHAHILRVCRLVAIEGTAVLYGENSFHFQRCNITRGRLWEKDWSQVGFKDIRRFLETIGSANISKLKYLSFALADGSSSGNGFASTERLFVHDPVLFRVFNLIGAHARLEKLGVMFNGSRDVNSHDYYFLKALTAMKCYELQMPASAMGFTTRIDMGIRDKVKQLMEAERPANIDKDKKKVKVNMVFDKPGASSYNISKW